MNFKEIIEHINSNFSENIISQVIDYKLISIAVIETYNLLKIATFLQSNDKMYFDFLSCVTAMDNGVEKNTMEVVYNFYSIPYNQKFCLKVILDRQNPEIESVSTIWHTANWHEREAFDLLGIKFKNHPDLRRILNPEDWEGHPLQKNYQVQETYHDIKVKY